jgi:ligand-binding sensor domain-containing protein
MVFLIRFEYLISIQFIKLRLLLACIILLNTLPIHSQITSTFTSNQISLADGLSQVTVICILKDSQGFIWFGTVDGLNRYDGYQIKVFKNDPANPFSITSNRIQCLYEDSKGNLWIGTDGGGLNKFNRKTEQFNQYPLEQNSQKRVSAILGEKGNQLWVRTEGDKPSIGIFNPENQSLKFFDYPNVRGMGRTGDFTKSMLQDRNGNIWFAVYGAGLYRFDKKPKRSKTLR